jgi:hypothetical protein
MNKIRRKISGIYRRIRNASWLGHDRSFQKEFLYFEKLSSAADKRFSLNWDDRYPCMDDNTATTSFDSHYIYHTAWAARIVKQINPQFHIDLSSRLYFSTMLSAFIPVKLYDFRPVSIKLEGLTSGFADVLKLPFDDHSVYSLSCMHTIEHIGLGRYGDPFDYNGDLKAINELKRVVAFGGNLLFVVPLGGTSRIMFNAHRIYTYRQVVSCFEEFQLLGFSLVTDNENDEVFISSATEEQSDRQKYGCGCFWFMKDRSKMEMVSLREKHISDLKAEIKKIKIKNADTASESLSYWMNLRKQIREYVLNKDPRYFLFEDFSKAYFFIDEAEYTLLELHTLQSDGKNWKDRYEKALLDDSKLPSPRLQYYPQSNGNLIHHLFHLKKFEDFSKKKIHELDLIVEFGGGYGNMAWLCKKLGFHGTYIIYDGPEFILLQQYFLQSNNVDCTVVNELPATLERNSVMLFSDLNVLGQIQSGSANSLLIATWSLSETPVELRRQFLGAQLVKQVNNFLLAYQVKIFENDNDAFFIDFAARKKELHWESELIEHIPDSPSKYMIGYS